MQAIPPALRFWHMPWTASWHGHALDSHLLLNLWIALGLFTLANILLVVGVVSQRRAHRPIHKLTLEYLPLIGLRRSLSLPRRPRQLALGHAALHRRRARRPAGRSHRPAVRLVLPLPRRRRHLRPHPQRSRLRRRGQSSRPRPRRPARRRRHRPHVSSSFPPAARSTSPSAPSTSSMASPSPRCA